MGSETAKPAAMADGGGSSTKGTGYAFSLATASDCSARDEWNWLANMR